MQIGVHPDYHKKISKIETAQLPKKVILPLSQHIGSPSKSIVVQGDYVKTGQKIAESSSAISADIHASISGVVSIQSTTHPVTGKPIESIIIEGDELDEKADMIKSEFDDLNPEELRMLIQRAGIVGLGGAAFPTHIKLNPKKKIDTLIINGAECEPYLTTDHALMLEKQKELIFGIRIIKKILGAKEVFIGIEDNKKDAIRQLESRCADQNVKVISLKTIYPQGAEKILIHSVTKRKVPTGGLPMDVGCVVANVGTAIAIYEACAFSKPLYERVVTIAGAVQKPKIFLARIGTPVKDLIEQASGYIGEPIKILNGGPMMGFAMPNDELPIIKGTSGIVVVNKDLSRKRLPCIKCGFCSDVCPMKLHPNLIAGYSEKDMIDQAENVYALDCFECGNCSYICPSKIPLVQLIRYGKSEIMKRMKK